MKLTAGEILVMYTDIKYFTWFWSFSQSTPNGFCVKATLNEGNAEWVKTDCSDTSGKGYVCQRRQNLEDVGKIKNPQLF